MAAGDTILTGAPRADVRSARAAVARSGARRPQRSAGSLAMPCTVIDLDRARAARRDRDTRALAHLVTVTYEISDRVSPRAWWARPLVGVRRRRLVRRILRGH
jgi:hypothetical protein